MLDTAAKRWTAVCCLGYLGLFGSFLVTGAIADLFRPEAWPDAATMATVDPAAPPERFDPVVFEAVYRFNIVHHVLHLAAFGALLGWLQASVLRGGGGRARPDGGDLGPVSDEPPVRRGAWSLLTAAGFTIILGFEAVRPGLVAGGHPAPIEPIMIALGGGSLAGLLQWVYLRRRGVAGGRWLGLWIGGLAAGVVAAIVVLTLVGPLLEPAARALFDDDTVWLVGQVIFFTLYGSVVGGVAGWISGRAIAPLRDAAARLGAAPAAAVE